MKGNGFTVIELLVVIAIIGLLSSIVLIVTTGAKSSARDARRVTDVMNIQEALALYQYTYSIYPIYDGYITGSDIVSVALSGEDFKMPLDPINDIDDDGSVYRYRYNSVPTQGSTYVIEYYLETNSIAGRAQGSNFVSP